MSRSCGTPDGKWLVTLCANRGIVIREACAWIRRQRDAGFVERRHRRTFTDWSTRRAPQGFCSCLK